MQNRDQLRAQAAFAAVSAVARASADRRKKYSTRCRQMPALIHRSGLCQAIAFYQASSAPAQQQDPKPEAWAFREFLQGFSQAVLLSRQPNERTIDHLATISRNAAFAEYQWLSRDALQSATWFKRYAEALLDDEDNPE
jgi:CRISPR-associated protein Cmr5